ncbi:hypothetical protein [Kitasatospora sp. MAP5-34]|uniref:hypothetical protein n=1 Tax=Kitasatospora sp. MAP5-34 TaxID=3035102 RepID=UPI002473727E|nr:hypothetical protein [Kitasatospora sp. MAP5-34]MDH6576625.1 hypothetical protein [Kitasatospora sp. MAP5-34]
MRRGVGSPPELSHGLARVQSSRALDYVREFNIALAPWRREPRVAELLHRTRTEFGIAA